MEKLKIYKPCLTMFYMRKKIKKYGNSLVIVFTKEDAESYKLKEGNIIEIKFNKIKKVVKNKQ